MGILQLVISENGKRIIFFREHALHATKVGGEIILTDFPLSVEIEKCEVHLEDVIFIAVDEIQRFLEVLFGFVGWPTIQYVVV